MKININDTVRVRLTEAGQDRYYGLTFNKATGLQMPLWELMQIFGPGLHIGIGITEMYFVDNEIELCAKT